MQCRRLRNDHSGDADERGDLALQNSRLTQALQQARDRIHKMEAEARSTTDDSEQRLKAVREAEDRVRGYKQLHRPAVCLSRLSLRGTFNLAGL